MSIIRARRVCFGLLLLGSCSFLNPREASAVAEPATAVSPATLNAAWSDLASADEGKVVKAILTLSKTPKEAVAFLRDNLLPVKADPKVVEQLVQQLNSDKFETRQRATEELEYLGKYIKDDLTKALAAAQGVEPKQRLQQLLDRLPDPAKDKAMPNLGNARSISTSIVNGQVRVVVDGVPLDLTPKAATPVGPPMFWVRAARAGALLEHLGEPGAKPLLESLAGGEEDALPTQAARQALERLNKK